MTRTMRIAIVILQRRRKENESTSKLQPDVVEKQQKRKPVGVTSDTNTAGTTTTTTPTADQAMSIPNFFVNVMNTVSGRIIYRISHANVDIAAVSMMNILISENWIYYTFVNQKTRRTEVGVVSLYEGMIDPKGLTAFTSAESVIAKKQFTLLDAWESNPFVLAKTYTTVPKFLTALGITTTRGGISTRKILIATTVMENFYQSRALNQFFCHKLMSTISI
jgi:ER membrane protein complex subunit 1, C-terminal